MRVSQLPFLVISSSAALAGSTTVGAAVQRPTAITHASVLPMDRNSALTDQTIIVRNGRIEALGPSARVKVPRDATIISARGQWVVPGLADMHSHIHDPSDFPAVVENGVTTLLDMGGGSDDFHGRLRRAIDAGVIDGPKILTALKIDGPGDEGGTSVVPKDEASARAAVRAGKRQGYDFIKVYSRLSPPIFFAIMNEARRVKLAVIGHVVRSVGLAKSLAVGQVMIAHSEEYLTVLGDDPPDDARIPELVELTRKSGATVTANVDGIERIAAQWGKPAAMEAFIREGQAQNLRPALMIKWRKAAYSRLDGSYEAEAQFAGKLVAALHRAGVPILVGTDAPDIPGSGPGFSVHAELAALHRLGFSNFDALAAATSVAGRFVARCRPNAERFGMIRPGYRADLLVVPGDPRADLAALLHPQRVMARGRWLVDRALPVPKQAIAARYSAAQVASDLTYVRDVYLAKDRSFAPAALQAARAFLDREIAAAKPASRAQIALLIAQAQAFSGNNHTQNDIFDEEGDFHPLPIAFWRFSDGVFITRTHPAFSDLLGSRILALDGIPIDEAEARVARYISGTAQHHRYEAPAWLRRIEVLEAIDLARKGIARFTIVDGSGRQRTVALAASPTRDPAVQSLPWRESVVPGKGDPPWPQVTDRLASLPLYLQSPADLTWHYIDDGRTLYIRSNDLYAYDDAHPIESKVYAMFEKVMHRPSPPNDVIVDLRFNEGGDFLKVYALANELVAMTEPNGRVYVITGRATNSAAIILTAMLKGKAPHRTRIVGEEVSDREYFWSEGGNLTAPATGLRLRYTDGYHDWANGCTDRSRCYWPAMLLGVKAGSLRPDIRVAPSYFEYVSGRDSSLQAVEQDMRSR